MKNFHVYFLLVSCIFVGIIYQTSGQCSSDSSCTDLCGYAGAGKCVNSTHCVCETCPQRSTAELSVAYALKVCSPELICQSRCPASSFSIKTGKLYTGHVCGGVGTNGLVGLTCICFCMPTTLASLGTVIRCPVLPNITALTG